MPIVALIELAEEFSKDDQVGVLRKWIDLMARQPGEPAFAAGYLSLHVCLEGCEDT